MTIFLPQPLLSLILLLTWLLATGFSPGQILLGAVLALAIPWFTQRFWPQPVRLRRPRVLARLVARVLVDIIYANLNVARLILGPATAIRPALVRYPLRLRDEFAITVLANTISLTPGTVTADLSEDRAVLLLHALDIDDPQLLIDAIHTRYEKPLQEIFEPC